MKKTGICILICLLIPLLSFTAYCVDIGDGIELAEQAVPYEIRQQLQSEGISSVGELLKLSPSELWRYITTRLTEGVRSAFKGVLTVMGVMLITSAFTHSIGLADLGATAAMELATMLWITYAITSSVGTVVSDAIRAVEQCGLFMLSYIPIFSGVAVASGTPSSALVYHTTLIWVAQAVSQVAANILAPRMV